MSTVGINRIVILSEAEAKDFCIFARAAKSIGVSRVSEFAYKLPRRVCTDLSCAHNLPWCMRS